jgi:hypothetical protein
MKDSTPTAIKAVKDSKSACRVLGKTPYISQRIKPITKLATIDR